MKQERSWLLSEGMPLLHELAQETGMMIQIVDLFWGVSEDAALDPSLYDVYLEQIDHSRQYSAGPFFAVRHLVPQFQNTEVHGWRNKLGTCVRRPKNVKFGTKVAFSTRIIHRTFLTLKAKR